MDKNVSNKWAVPDSIPSQIEHEQVKWLSELHRNFPDAAVFTVIDKFSVSSENDKDFQYKLQEINDKNLKFDSLQDAIYACDFVDLSVSAVQCQRLEGSTRMQSISDM